MNNKDKRIDEFLKYFRDIAYQNPDYRFSVNNIYNELTNLGTKNYGESERIDHLFPGWINHFCNHSNICVFNSPQWKYFCQFRNYNNSNNPDENLKIYIPLDSEHIELGAKEIFEFLSSQNIIHESKIGSHIRFDDIVVRVNSIDDFLKVNDFIQKNEYIKEGLIEASPFAYSYQGLSLAVDGRLSYNATVAKLIKLYINNKIDIEALNEVNVDDFYKFIDIYYNKNFSCVEGFYKIFEDFGEEKFYHNNNCYERLNNYKDVIKLISDSRKPEFTIIEFMKHYANCSDYSVKRDKISQLKKIPFIEQKEKENQINQQLLNLIDGITEKSKNQYKSLWSIDNYIKENNKRYITRHKKLRETIANSSFRDDIINLLDEKGIDFIEYAQELINEREKQNKLQKLQQNEFENFSASELEKSTIITIQEIIKIMSDKYNANTAYANLIEFIKTGKPNLLTKDYDLRERIVNSTFIVDVKKIIQSRDISVDEYIYSFSNIFIEQNKSYLDEAIMETYSKYEKKYQEGVCDIDGYRFACEAVFELFKDGEYTGFTRDNDARKNLSKNVPSISIKNIIEQSFGIKKINKLSEKDLYNLINCYTNEIIKNNIILKTR